MALVHAMTMARRTPTLKRSDALPDKAGGSNVPGDAGGDAPASPDAQLLSAKDQLLVTRALQMPLGNVVIFFGVLLSTAVLQLYIVGAACAPRCAPH